MSRMICNGRKLRLRGGLEGPEVDSMVECFKSDPVAYIKEACRIDPPVTSATQVCKEEKEVIFKGRSYLMPKDTYLLK